MSDRGVQIQVGRFPGMCFCIALHARIRASVAMLLFSIIFAGLLICGGLLGSLFIPESAHALTSEEVQAQADEAQVQLDAKMEELERASDDYNTALYEHDQAVVAMNAAQTRIDAASSSISDAQSRLSSRAREMYRNGSISMLDVALGVSSYEDFVTTWDLLSDLNNSDAETIDELDRLRDDQREARDEYDAQAKIAAEKLSEAEQAKTDLQEAVDDYRAIVDALDAQAAALLKAEQSAESSLNGASYDGDNVIVAAAFSKIGCTYSQGEYGSRTGPDSFDCSGLTQWCYAQAGISIPGTSTTQSEGMTHVPLVDAEPGDVLWKPGHVAIYAGGDIYVHASDYGVGVIVSSGIGTFVCALRP